MGGSPGSWVPFVAQRGSMVGSLAVSHRGSPVGGGCTRPGDCSGTCRAQDTAKSHSTASALVAQDTCMLPKRKQHAEEGLLWKRRSPPRTFLCLGRMAQDLWLSKGRGESLPSYTWCRNSHSRPRGADQSTGVPESQGVDQSDQHSWGKESTPAPIAGPGLESCDLQPSP